MNLLQMVLNSQDGGLVKQLGSKFNLSESDAQGALGQLMPALSRGISRNASSEGGLDSLFKALSSGSHQQYIDKPETLGNSESVADGNAILGHILGSKDVSRKVAGAAAGKTGIDGNILKKMLPMVATLAMGGLSKQSSSQGLAGLKGGGQSSGALGMLNSFLDSDKDGSSLDDLLGGIAGKFLK